MAELALALKKSRPELVDPDVLKKKVFEVSNFSLRNFSPKTIKFFSGFQSWALCVYEVKSDQKPKMTKTKNIGPKDCILTKNDKIWVKKYFSVF